MDRSTSVTRSRGQAVNREDGKTPHPGEQSLEEGKAWGFATFLPRDDRSEAVCIPWCTAVCGYERMLHD